VTVVLRGPEPELIVDPEIQEAGDVGARRRVAFHLGHVPRRLHQRFDDLVRFVGITRAHVDVVPAERCRPSHIVDERLGDLAVGHGDDVAVAGTDPGLPPVGLDDLAFQVVDADPAARLDGAHHVQRHAGQQIPEYALQGETDHGGEQGGGGEQRCDIDVQLHLQHHQRHGKDQHATDDVQQQIRNREHLPAKQEDLEDTPLQQTQRQHTDPEHLPGSNVGGIEFDPGGSDGDGVQDHQQHLADDEHQQRPRHVPEEIPRHFHQCRGLGPFGVDMAP